MRDTEGTPPADLVAFCTLEHDPLVRFLSLYCGDGPLAEELAQDALIRACQRWAQVREMQSPRAWLRRVAVNGANSYFRRRGAEKRARSRLDAPAEMLEPTDVSEVLALRQSLARISPRQRTALLMRFFDDMRVREIAVALDCSENTVKSLLRRGLAALRDTDTIKNWKGALDVV